MRQSQGSWFFALQLTTWLTSIGINAVDVPQEVVNDTTKNLASCSRSQEPLSPQKRPAAILESSSPSKRIREDVSIELTLGLPHESYPSFHSTELNSAPQDTVPLHRPEQPATYSVLDSDQQPPVRQTAQTLDLTLWTNQLDFNKGASTSVSKLETLEDPTIDILNMKLEIKDPQCQKLLTDYLAIFERRLQTLHYLTGARSKLAEYRSFTGIPVTLVSVAINKVSTHLVRVSIVPNSSKKRFEAPSDIRPALEPLFKWLLLQNAVLMRQFGNNENDIEATQKKILGWLVAEFFDPGDHSLPVHGKVHHPPLSLDQDAFGIVQHLFIRLVSSSMTGKNSRKTAMKMLGIWYKNFDLPTWKIWFGSDAKFWRTMVVVTEIAQASNPAYVVRPQVRVAGPSQLGNFRLLDLKSLLSTVHVSSISRESIYGLQTYAHSISNSHVKETLVNIGRDIVDQVGLFYKACDLHKRPEARKFSEIEVALMTVENKPQGLKQYVIGHLAQSGNPFWPNEMKEQLASLMKSLTRFHIAISYISHIKGHKIIPDTHINMFQWLRKQLFDPTDPSTSLPVFGKVDVLWNTYVKNTFGDVQKIIINFIKTVEPSRSEVEQFLATIVGYWYKTVHYDIWMANFNEDEEYWWLVASLLKTDF